MDTRLLIRPSGRVVSCRTRVASASLTGSLLARMVNSRPLQRKRLRSARMIRSVLTPAISRLVRRSDALPAQRTATH